MADTPSLLDVPSSVPEARHYANSESKPHAATLDDIAGTDSIVGSL